MIVVVDTNVFVRESLLLSAGIGPLFLHFLRAKRGKLFVPGILRREYVEQAIEAVREARREIEPRLTRIHAIVGVMTEYQLPTDKDVESGAEARLSELAPLILETTTTDEIMVAAGHRSVAKQPPSTKTDHGYKDCLIWESILRLPSGSDVHLVTHDKAFFEGERISPVLGVEARERGLAVSAHQYLDGVLKLLQDGQPPLDFSRVTPVLDAALEPLLTKLESQWGIGSIFDAASQLVPYFTERLDRTYVTFTQAYSVDSAMIDSEVLEVPIVVISGSFIWVESSGSIENLQVQSEKLNDATGRLIRENVTIHARMGAISFGPRRVPFTVRGLLSANERASNQKGSRK